MADKHRPDRCRDSMCERLPCVWYKAGYQDGYDDGVRMAAR